MGDKEMEERARAALQESILRGLGVTQDSAAARGYLMGLEERIEALERKVDALEKNRQR